MKYHSVRTILLGIGASWFLCLNFLLYFPVTSHADPDSERKALLSLRTALGGRLRRSWNISSPTCSWVGVVCDGNNVIELHFPGMGLKGQLPLGSIGNLTHLQIVSLRFNSIVTPIPSDFTNLASLQTLQLEGNSLFGNIPDVFFSLQSLTNLSLASNKFTGDIPLSFNNLTKLVSLDLEKNQLTGLIPDLNLQLDHFNVSHNQLSGAIPSRFSGMPESVFEGNLQLCDKPLKPCNGTDSTPGGKGGNQGKGGNKLKSGVIAGIVISCALGFIFLLLALVFCCRKSVSSWEDTGSTPKRVESRGIQLGGKSVRPTPPEEVVIISEGSKLVFLGNQSAAFTLEDLLRAPSEVLGRGVYGTSYKAELVMGDGTIIYVVVKRLREVSLPETEFTERIREIGRLDHENLLTPMAYYYGMDEKLLVLDHVALGSLSSMLHGGDATALSWEARCKIALGAGRGIAHLHSQQAESDVSAESIFCSHHGNIKSSNILLTETYEPRVSDFGLPILANCPPSRNFQGYLDDDHQVHNDHQSSDTYSYGVLLLELLTGKDPNSAIGWNEDDLGAGLSMWVKLIMREEGVKSVFDPQLLRYQNVEDDMVRVLKIALDCTQRDPPSMTEVVHKMEDICTS